MRVVFVVAVLALAGCNQAPSSHYDVSRGMTRLGVDSTYGVVCYARGSEASAISCVKAF